MRRFIIVTTNFTGFHRWKDAPKECEFLRDWHRHIFYVEMMVEVNHNERDIEFITLKKELDNFLRDTFEQRYFEHSCETLAQIIIHYFAHCYDMWAVSVKEDNENGAMLVNDNMKTEDYFQLYSCRCK